jgi:Sec-independent protein secretion pathway component TatC
VAAQEGEMSFWDHLEVLRGTLFRSLGAIVLVSVVFMAIPTRLFQAVLWPSTSDFILYKWLGLDFGMELINIEVSAQFFVHLKISFLMAVLVTFPYIVWEIWKFIAPALYRNEKKAVRKPSGCLRSCSTWASAVGYFIVLPVCLMFFMNYKVSDAVQNTISLNSYISLFISMVFLIGLLFEFPTVVLVLSHLGLLTREQLRKGRKIAFVVILILAALITPSDPFRCSSCPSRCTPCTNSPS